MDGDGTEQLLEVVPDGFTNEELLKLKQGHITEEIRQKETPGKERKMLPKFHNEEFNKNFSGLNKLLKMFENMDPNQQVFSNKEKVHDALSAYKCIYNEKGNKPSKPPLTYF